MAKIEIEESDFLASQNIVRTVQAMLANPEARKMVLTAQKKVLPNVVIPEIDAAEPIAAETAKALDAVAALNKRMDDEKAERENASKVASFAQSWERQKEMLRAAGWQDEGIAKIEEHAQKEGIANLRAAAADYEKLNPPPPPATPTGFGAIDLFLPDDKSDEQFKKLMDSKGNDDGALNSMINSALTDIRGGVARR